MVDLQAPLAAGAALAATGAAAVLARRRRPCAAALLLALAGLVFRADLSDRAWLGKWDERYHAVVARNLVEHPLRPTLNEFPLEDHPPSAWTESHLWLHKPPGALWPISASLALLGPDEHAVRIPSLFAAWLGVLCTFALGRHFFGTPAGLLAAGFHAWNGRSALVASGLRATDHVDTLVAFFVELAALLGVLAARRLRAAPSGWVLAAGCGLATGYGVLTKDAPALVALVAFGTALLVERLSWRRRLAAGLLAAASAAAVFVPWRLYTAHAFPEHAAWATRRALRYFTHVVDGQGGPWTFHLENLPDHFGPLAPLALALFAVRALREPGRGLALLAWIAVTYAVFSVAPTKMDSYVFVAAPAVWSALGAVAVLPAGLPEGSRRRAAAWILGAGLVLGALHDGLRAWRPWEPRPRVLVLAEELRSLGARVSELPGGPWVVFSVPSPAEARFYARAGFERGLPDERLLGLARERGYRVALYGRDPLPGEPPGLRQALLARPDVRVLPVDPRTAPHRALLRQLRSLGPGPFAVYGARAAEDLEAWLEAFVAVRVYGSPAPSARERARHRRRGRQVVVLAPAGAAPETGPDGIIRLPAPAFARPPDGGAP